MEMHHGNMIHNRLLEIMEFRQMVLMVGKLAMVVMHLDGWSMQKSLCDSNEDELMVKQT